MTLPASFCFPLKSLLLLYNVLAREKDSTRLTRIFLQVYHYPIQFQELVVKRLCDKKGHLNCFYFYFLPSQNAGQASTAFKALRSVGAATELTVTLVTGAALAPQREWVQVVRKTVWSILNNQILTAFQ